MFVLLICGGCCCHCTLGFVYHVRNTNFSSIQFEKEAKTRTRNNFLTDYICLCMCIALCKFLAFQHSFSMNAQDTRDEKIRKSSDVLLLFWLLLFITYYIHLYDFFRWYFVQPSKRLSIATAWLHLVNVSSQNPIIETN